MEGSASWWPLELNDVAFWILDIHGRTLALRAIARLHSTHFHTVRLEMTANACVIKGLDPKAEVIQVACFRSWWRSSSLAKFAVDGHQINEGSTRAQLNQADSVLTALYGAPKRSTVETKHSLEVDDTQDEMVNFANADHGGRVEAAWTRWLELRRVVSDA